MARQTTSVVRKKSKREMALEKDFSKHLNKVVDSLFSLAERKRWTLYRLSTESNVSYQTLERLWSRKTKKPGLLTVWKICKSLGVAVKVTTNTATLVPAREAA